MMDRHHEHVLEMFQLRQALAAAQARVTELEATLRTAHVALSAKERDALTARVKELEAAAIDACTTLLLSDHMGDAHDAGLDLAKAVAGEAGRNAYMDAVENPGLGSTERCAAALRAKETT